MVDRSVMLITGASRGIGHYLTCHYAARGHEVIGCSRTRPGSPPNANYSHFQVDIANEAEVVEMFRRIRREYGRLDVLINNAAINPTLSLAVLVSNAVAIQAMQTNVLGTFVASREAAKLMMRRRFGRIVNFGSMAVRHEVPGEAIYTATKAAVVALSRVMAKELYGHGITCNVIAPSAVPSEMMSSVPAEALSSVLARNAIPELGKNEDISETIDWLIRPESQAITGQVIYLGGA